MRRCSAYVVLVLALFVTGWPATAVAQGATCADFDAWEWAQAVFESDPQQYDALDPDNDGEACPELPRGGFAPAFWTDEIPEDVEEARLLRIVDGDTFEVEIDGVSNRVRIYRADTPETQNEQHCGGAEATAFTEFVLSFNDDEDGTVSLERDENERDQYGRELAYIWFEIDGLPYLLNHALINNGWAEDVDYGDRKYDDELQDAAAFAERHDLGVWELCGGFEVPLAQEPASEQPAQQEPVQPQEPVAVDPQPQPQQPEPEPQPAQQTGCDPSYPGVCIPPAPPDLDCPEVGYSGFTVVPPDPHGFDGDGDGVGCE